VLRRKDGGPLVQFSANPNIERSLEWLLGRFASLLAGVQIIFDSFREVVFEAGNVSALI
jgi:hypothetical protein